MPSFGPYHWCAASPQYVFLYSLALSCTQQLSILLAGMSSSSLPFPVVCESQFRGCRIVHHWPVTVGQVQRYVQSTCTPMTVWFIIQVKQKEPNTLPCILMSKHVECIEANVLPHISVLSINYTSIIGVLVKSHQTLHFALLHNRMAGEWD